MPSLSDLLYRLRELAGNKLRDHDTAAAVNALNDAVKAIAEEGGGGGGGTMNHASLNNRSAADQHPISAIAGLDAALAGKAGAATATTSTAGLMSAADKTKLDAAATNAELRDRATHSGEQAISTVTGLQTALDGKQKLITQSSTAPSSPSVGDLWIEVI
jgi:hypothetical protein